MPMPSARPLPIPQAWLDPASHAEELTLETFPSVLMLAAGTLVQRNIIRPMLERHGLGISEWRTLISLNLYGPATSAEVVERSFMDKAQVSRAATGLERLNLIRRKQDAAHAKRWILSVTPKGIRLFEQLHAQSRQEQAALLQLLGANERRALFTGLQKIIDHARAGEGAATHAKD